MAGERLKKVDCLLWELARRFPLNYESANNRPVVQKWNSEKGAESGLLHDLEKWIAGFPFDICKLYGFSGQGCIANDGLI